MDEESLDLEIQELAGEKVDKLMNEDPEMGEELAWEIAMEEAESEVMKKYKE